MSSKKILIVDDEPDIREFLGYTLKKEGFLIQEAENGVIALEKNKVFQPDLIILDLMMPVMDGIETCYQIRQESGTLPRIIFLTARNEDYSEISGLEAGADDYVTKPIKPRVLLSRIKAILRRGETEATEKSGQKSIGGFLIDWDKYVVVKDAEEFSLPKKEMELFGLLFSAPGKVFERDVIMSRVWGAEVIVGDRTIDVHIRKLREKFGSDHFVTVKGVGYKFDPLD